MTLLLFVVLAVDACLDNSRPDFEICHYKQLFFIIFFVILQHYNCIIVPKGCEHQRYRWDVVIFRVGFSALFWDTMIVDAMVAGAVRFLPFLTFPVRIDCFSSLFRTFALETSRAVAFSGLANRVLGTTVAKVRCGRLS